MSDDSQSKILNRRSLLLAAWTSPVVASFALGGAAIAGTKTIGIGMNGSVGQGPLMKTANATGPFTTTKTPAGQKPK